MKTLKPNTSKVRSFSRKFASFFIPLLESITVFQIKLSYRMSGAHLFQVFDAKISVESNVHIKL